jgi:hypothetical protein
VINLEFFKPGLFLSGLQATAELRAISVNFIGSLIESNNRFVFDNQTTSQLSFEEPFLDIEG